MKTINVPATMEQLERVQEFISEELEAYDCSVKAQFQIEMAVEEIFANIVHYAYNPSIGEATICCEIYEDPLRVTIQFLDDGKPFDPFAREDADTSTDALEEREGGLGILIVKKSMDEVSYSYADGKNVLTILKML
jgi:anti-sigma regulatory factor (Ser/Thr protein kinase)